MALGDTFGRIAAGITGGTFRVTPVELQEQFQEVRLRNPSCSIRNTLEETPRGNPVLTSRTILAATSKGTPEEILRSTRIFKKFQ